MTRLLELVALVTTAETGPKGVSVWVYFAGGVGTFVAAIAGAIALLRKLGPEVNNIQITSAQSLVTMAEQNAKMSSDQADRLLSQNKILDDRLTEYARQLGEATTRLDQLEEKAREVDALREEVARERAAREAESREKQRIADENARLRARVDSLEQELAVLKAVPAVRGERGPRGDRGDMGRDGPPSDV